jgi:hypothetical protein
MNLYPIWAAVIYVANWLLLKAGVRDGSEHKD